MTTTVVTRLNNSCSVCSETVPLCNDAVYFQFFLTGDALLAFTRSKHLLPVVVDGKTVCTGSPSRAQYLEGQVLDSRPGSMYNPANKARYRDAYARLQGESLSAPE